MVLEIVRRQRHGKRKRPDAFFKSVIAIKKTRLPRQSVLVFLGGGHDHSGESTLTDCGEWFA